MTVHDVSIRYRRRDVDGLNIFYREAGSPTAPAVLLLHGFPTSSHMFRDLIPLLAPHVHVVAPDLPGFGFSDAPSRSDFAYTFDHLADVIERLHRSDWPHTLCALYLRLRRSSRSSPGPSASGPRHGDHLSERECL